MDGGTSGRWSEVLIHLSWIGSGLSLHKPTPGLTVAARVGAPAHAALGVQQGANSARIHGVLLIVRTTTSWTKTARPPLPCFSGAILGTGIPKTTLCEHHSVALH